MAFMLVHTGQQTREIWSSVPVYPSFFGSAGTFGNRVVSFAVKEKRMGPGIRTMTLTSAICTAEGFQLTGR